VEGGDPLGVARIGVVQPEGIQLGHA